MRQNGIIVVCVIVALLVAAFAWYVYSCQDDWCFLFEWQKIRATNSYEECVARGFPIEESSPARCRAGSKIFVGGL